MKLSNKQVTFFQNGQAFQTLNELASSEQNDFIDRWNKWEERVWRSAYESIHETLDPKKTMTLSVLRRENS
ncbi:MAG: hypothetical protein ACQET8_21980 [Bacillota bacterium]